MACNRLHALPLAFPIFAAALAPDTAEACPQPGPCYLLEFWGDLAPVNAAQIPADGVLVLQGTHENGADEDWLTQIELTVTKDGQPTAGALEATSLHGVLAWRPAAPFEPGAALKVNGKVTNPDEASSYNCADEEIVFAADLMIDAENGAPLEPVELVGVVETESAPVVSFETLACCPGAAPEPGSAYNYCDLGETIDWDPATCTPIATHGYLSVTLTGGPATTGPAAEQVLYTLKVDGAAHSVARAPSFSVHGDAAFCAVIEAMDLASGAITSSAEQCFGQDLGDVLGQHPLEPAELGCPLQQCEVVDGLWDPTMCTPLDTEPSPTTSDTMVDADATDTDPSDSGGSQDGGDEGCACAAAPTGDAGLLALVGLLGLGRRRQARS